MYKTLLVFDNYDLLEEIKKLSIWGDSSEFEITDVVSDGVSAYRKIRENRYDLVITEIRIMGMDGLQLLRNVKKEGICSHIVLCSEFEDFNYARQGIILGAYDYFVKPFDETLFFSMFNRIKNETFGGEATGIYYAEELMHGKQSQITFDKDCLLFQACPENMQVARYHSLAAEMKTMPECLKVTAKTEDGEVMAVQHKDYPIYGVQFHPESIMTPDGKTMLKNFLQGGMSR